MEEKIYDRQVNSSGIFVWETTKWIFCQVTKQSLSARVVDEQQIERHFTMNELSELYIYKEDPLVISSLKL